MTTWRKSSALVTAALVGGIISPATPIAAAQGTVQKDVPVTHRCQSIFNGSDVEKAFKMGLGTGPGGANMVSVEYPAGVKRGEVFTAYVQPGPMTTASGSGDGYQAGRLSYDIALPANAVILSAQSIGGESEISPDSSAIKVDRYTDLEGHSGQSVRIWGGASVPLSSGTTGIIETGYWNAGLRVRGGKTFRFPRIAIRMRAPVAQGGNTIAAGLKGAGTHTSGSAANGNLNTFMGAHRSGYTPGSYWWSSRFYCSSSDNARVLTPTVVGSDVNERHIAQTSTTLLTTDSTLPSGGSRLVQLRAQVSTDEELMSNVRADGAGVRFDMTNRSTGVTTSTKVGVGENGVAIASVTFDPPSGSNIREDYDLRATYTGREGDIASSSSSTSTITSAYNERVADIELSSQNGALSGGSMPVTVKAKVSMPSGVQFPGGMQVRLYRNDEPLDVVTVSSGGTGSKEIAFTTQNLTQATGTKTYRYRAEVVPLITNNTLDRFTGGSSVGVAAIVTGSNPGSQLPGGGHGSLDLTNFFRVPELAWEAIGGSVGEMGTLSVSMTR